MTIRPPSPFARVDSLSLAQARRLAVAAQGLADHRLRPASRRAARLDDLRKTMNRLHLLQLDSVPVIARSQYLPLFARIGPYQADALDTLAYRRDEWFETWAHEASLMPVQYEPLMRWCKAQAMAGRVWKNLHRLAQAQPDYVERVYREVAERGPLCAAELSEPGSRGHGGWSNACAGSLALDWLFRVGRLGVRRRGNFEKAFDLIERIVPAPVLALPTPHETEAMGDLLCMAARALGVATADELIDYFRLPPRSARPLLAPLVEAGRLIACQVEGWPKPGYRAPLLPLPRRVQARALLSPFDPMVWHRARGRQLFGYDFSLEIYVPAARRRWGYYVLSFLLGDTFAARIDLKNDRAQRRLEVRASHVEPGRDRAMVASELAHELRELALFLGVGDIVVHRRGDLATALARALGTRARALDA